MVPAGPSHMRRRKDVGTKRESAVLDIAGRRLDALEHVAYAQIVEKEVMQTVVVTQEVEKQVGGHHGCRKTGRSSCNATLGRQPEEGADHLSLVDCRRRASAIDKFLSVPEKEPRYEVWITRRRGVALA